MFLLDTNACLDFLLARSPPLVDRVRREFRKLIISAITAAELRVGSKTSEFPEQDAQVVSGFLRRIPVAPFDDAAAAIYGAIGRERGVDRHSFDRLIAAHAISLDVVLVTGNPRDFRSISTSRTENWREA